MVVKDFLGHLQNNPYLLSLSLNNPHPLPLSLNNPHLLPETEQPLSPPRAREKLPIRRRVQNHYLYLYRLLSLYHHLNLFFSEGVLGFKEVLMPFQPPISETFSQPLSEQPRTKMPKTTTNRKCLFGKFITPITQSSPPHVIESQPSPPVTKPSPLLSMIQEDKEKERKLLGQQILMMTMM